MTNPPPVAHILETALYVDSLDRAVAFYQRVFGFTLHGQEERMAALAVPGGGVLLLFRRDASLHPSPTPGGTIPPHGGHGALHLCFAIPLLALPAWEAHLPACGVALESRVVQPHGGISLYFRDPDNNSVEVGTPGMWPNY